MNGVLGPKLHAWLMTIELSQPCAQWLDNWQIIKRWKMNDISHKIWTTSPLCVHENKSWLLTYQNSERGTNWMSIPFWTIPQTYTSKIKYDQQWIDNDKSNVIKKRTDFNRLIDKRLVPFWNTLLRLTSQTRAPQTECQQTFGLRWMNPHEFPESWKCSQNVLWEPAPNKAIKSRGSGSSV